MSLRRSDGKQAVLTFVFIVMLWAFILAIAFDDCAEKISK